MHAAAYMVSSGYTLRGKQVENFFPPAGDREGRKATASEPANLLDTTQCQTKCITGHGLELTFKT